MDHHTHYFVRKPRPNRNGICRILEQELFPGTPQDEQIVDVLYDGTAPNWYVTISGWQSWPPEDWVKLPYLPQSGILAQESGDACPPGDDKGYVSVGSMTDGMLKQFFALWRDISSSPEAFDRAFANTTSNAYANMGGKEDHEGLVRTLRQYLFEKNRARPALKVLDCNTVGRLEGCSAYFQGFVVGFDVGDSGLKITRLDQEMVI